MVNLLEIPTPRGANLDTFELFARDFLEAIGYNVVDGPDRGTDGGRDLIAVETLRGPWSEIELRWLVSVKHFAHSGRAVGLKDEPDLLERLAAFRADRFLGFYSTLPSSGWVDRLRKLDVPSALYDRGRISTALLQDSRLDRVFAVYLPQSYTKAKGRVDEGRLRLFTDLGYAPSERVEVNLPDVLDASAQGGLTISDPEIEDVMIACVLADALVRGRFSVLHFFASLRPVVWRTLTQLLQQRAVDRQALTNEIGTTTDATSLRLLIAIAGALRAEESVDMICRRLLSDGRRRAQEIAHLHLVITPLYDVILQALSSMPSGSCATIAFYQERAREQRRWREKRLLGAALRNITSHH